VSKGRFCKNGKENGEKDNKGDRKKTNEKSKMCKG
jgi:hypothetical protein